MITLESIGSYLGREIALGGGDDGGEGADNLEFNDATVLLLFSRPYNSATDKELLGSLLKSHPLAVLVAGEGARRAFDDLIEMTSTPEQTAHVMTGISDTADAEEAVSQLLHATWPAEERFDDWKRVVAFVVGPKTDSFNDARHALEDLSKQSAKPKKRKRGAKGGEGQI